MLSSVAFYHRVLGIRGVLVASWGKLTRRPALLKVRRSDLIFPFFLRIPSSDALAYRQIFFDHEYDFDVAKPPGVILDAGANIGLAAIYFASRFPYAKIVAIEPEASNFELLLENTAPYGNIASLQAALWSHEGEINVVDPGLGHWGYRTEEGTQASVTGIRHKIAAVTINKIMRDYQLDRIDICKMDIEGAESEVFGGAASWIDSINSVIIELHEEMNPTCKANFYESTTGFDYEWTQGENVYLSRNGQLLPSQTGAAPGY